MLLFYPSTDADIELAKKKGILRNHHLDCMLVLQFVLWLPHQQNGFQLSVGLWTTSLR